MLFYGIDEFCRFNDSNRKWRKSENAIIVAFRDNSRLDTNGTYVLYTIHRSGLHAQRVRSNVLIYQVTRDKQVGENNASEILRRK